MATSDTIKSTVWEDGGATNMARAVGQDAANITQASLTSISKKIFNLSTGSTTAVATAALSTASVVFDTLQTDARWTKDSTGYNFRDTVAATTLSTGDTVYSAEYRFVPTAGEPFICNFRMHTKSITGS